MVRIFAYNNLKIGVDLMIWSQGLKRRFSKIEKIIARYLSNL